MDICSGLFIGGFYGFNKCRLNVGGGNMVKIKYRILLFCGNLLFLRNVMFFEGWGF